MNQLFVDLCHGAAQVVSHIFSQLLYHALSLSRKLILFSVVDDRTLSYAFEVKPKLIETSVVFVAQSV